MDQSVQTVINNEYDYSNCMPTIECVTYLVKYMCDVYENFLKLQAEDEENNKQFKYEYKEWKFKRSFGERFEIYIEEKTYNNLTCKDFTSFQSAVEAGNLKNITRMKINMNISFKRGIGDNLEEYENDFYISFRPNDITFARKSDHLDSNITQIEENIKAILDKFPIINTIFCTK